MDFLIGCTGLVFSLLGLLYLFGRLIVIPLLPLTSDNIFNLPEAKPVEILMTLAISGLTFIGSLTLVIAYKLKH